jgi:hypothetical protein
MGNKLLSKILQLKEILIIIAYTPGKSQVNPRFLINKMSYFTKHAVQEVLNVFPQKMSQWDKKM